MQNWTLLLQSVLPQPSFDRPFVCDGFPSNGHVIIIGENPATDMSADWWSFWQPDLGFDYEAFLSDYTRTRALRGKSISNTRRRLERFRSNGVLCVETNAYQNQKPGGADSGVSNHAVLKLLIENMPDLKAIVAHGRVAHEFLDSFDVPVGVTCYKTRHFRMESYSVIDAICARIRDA